MPPHRFNLPLISAAALVRSFTCTKRFSHVSTVLSPHLREPAAIIYKSSIKDGGPWKQSSIFNLLSFGATFLGSILDSPQKPKWNQGPIS